MRSLTIAFFVALICAVASDALARTWTGRRGRLKVEAEYVETVGNLVRLRKTNGEVITVLLRLLSDADRQHIKELQQQNPEEKQDAQSGEGATPADSTVLAAKKFRIPKEPIPALGVMMLAFEGATTGQSRANPQIVQAMKKALDANPRARRTFEKMHRAYKQLPEEQREALVGQRMAVATVRTPLSLDSARTCFRHRTSIQAPTELKGLRIVERRTGGTSSAKERNTLEARHPNGKPPGITLGRGDVVPEDGKNVRGSTRDPLSEHVTVTFVKYKGLYCWDEDDDWGWSCEPYVIFVVCHDGESRSLRFGPYDDVDSGDARHRNQTLFNMTSPFQGAPVTITASCWENDNMDPDDVMLAVQLSLDFMRLLGVEIPPFVDWIMAELVPYLVDLLPADEDERLLPETRTFTIDEAYVSRHLRSHSTSKGFRYDKQLVFSGGAGRFSIYIDVNERDVPMDTEPPERRRPRS